MSEPGTEPEEPPARPGRHRRSAGAKTWTPVVHTGRGGRHYAEPPPATGLPEPRAELRTESAAPPAESFTPAAERHAAAETFTPAPESPPAAESPAEPFAAASTSEHVSGELPIAGPAELTSGALSVDLTAHAGLRELSAETGTLAGDLQPEPADESDTDTFAAVPAARTEDSGVNGVTVDGAPIENAEPVKRTKVTLTPPPEPRHDEVRVYAAPPPDGLSKFDLGSVPASVTPPRSWRKAAWFAATSSGGVVVALLVAGSYLVSTPSQPTAKEGNWPDLQGVQPYFDQQGMSDSTARPAPRSLDGNKSSAKQRITDLAGVSSGVSSTLPQLSTSARPTAPGTTTSPGAPSTTTTYEPQKPAPSPAERETKSPGFGFYADPEVMGDRSERFLNAITEDPDAARQETGGSLYAEGSDNMAADYEDIAYFEVDHIYIDQQNRQTINSVTVVYKDGTREQQQRTLRFEDGDKITSDGT